MRKRKEIFFCTSEGAKEEEKGDWVLSAMRQTFAQPSFIHGV